MANNYPADDIENAINSTGRSRSRRSINASSGSLEIAFDTCRELSPLRDPRIPRMPRKNKNKPDLIWKSPAISRYSFFLINPRMKEMNKNEKNRQMTIRIKVFLSNFKPGKNFFIEVF